MDDLMDFIPSGWRRDLIHMVGCFYASQIAPLNSREWDNDWDKFIWVMDEHKDSEWLDIKELASLQYMPYVARCFQETTGHHLQGLGQHTRWIRARSYYHWKVAELDQLKHCPHLQGLPVPLGPMECPSELQQPQRPNKPGATAPGASGHSGAGGQMTSGSLDEPSLMEGGAGDGPSWYEQVTREEARKGACKRKRTDTDQQAPGHPFPLGSESDRKEAMGAIYEHMVGQEPPQKNIASRAISAYYPNRTPTAVKTVASQVLCMIAEYHLACATRDSTTTSPILPEAVEQYLPPLVDYAHPGNTGLTDVRVRDHKARSLHVGVWLHRVDMSLSWEKEASESLVQSRHSKGLLLSYLLAPGTSNLHFEEVVSRVLQENQKEHERAKEKFRSSLNRSLRQWARLLRELDKLSKGLEAATDRKARKEIDERMGIVRTSLDKAEASVAENEDHLEESRIREEEAGQGDQGQSNSSEGQDDDVMVEGPEENGPTGAESTSPLRSQEAEPSIEVDMPLTSGGAITVTAEEDDMLTGDPTSVAGKMAKLQVTSPDSHNPEDGKTSQ